MNELIEKVENLKKALDEDQRVRELKTKKAKILAAEDLLKQIEEYKRTRDSSLLDEIKNNKLFQEYKHSETGCNLLILEINQKLKEINKGRKCHENN